MDELADPSADEHDTQARVQPFHPGRAAMMANSVVPAISRGGAKGGSRTLTPFRAPDPKVAAARHGSRLYVSSCASRCRPVPAGVVLCQPVSFRREQTVSKVSRQQQCLPCVYVEHNPRIERVGRRRHQRRRLAAIVTGASRAPTPTPPMPGRCTWSFIGGSRGVGSAARTRSLSVELGLAWSHGTRY